MAYTFDPSNPYPWLPQGTSFDYSGAMSGGGGGGGAGVAGFSPNPAALGIGAIGAAGGLYSSIKNSGVQKKLMDEQLRLSRLQRGQFQQNLPQYQSALEHYANMIGLSNSEGLNGYSSSVGVSPHQAGRLGIDPNTQFQTGTGPQANNGYMMGPYDQQAFRLRSAAAEQNLQHQMQGSDANLLFQAQQRGLASGSTAAALAREHQGLLQNYGDYQRQLAIGAGQQEQSNLHNYLAMLEPGLGMAGPAESVLGQQAGIYGNMAQQGSAAAGSALGSLAQMYGQQMPYPQQQNPYGGYGGYPYPSPYSYPPVGGLSGSGSNY